MLPVLGLVFFGATGRDDAYITYWAAHALARTGEIVNYNGARVEQSSSLLHVVLLAVTSRLTGLSVPATGWLVGVVGGMGLTALAVVMADRLEPGAGWRAGLLVASTAYAVYWSFGGLETSLAAAALLLALLGSDGMIRGRKCNVAVSALLYAPYLMSRPEAPVVLGAIGIWTLGYALAGTRWPALSAFSDVRAAVRPLAATVVITVGVVAFRLFYFGDVVPQPARAKIGGLRVHDGSSYLSQWLLRPAPLVLVMVVVIVASVRRRATPLEALVWMAAAAQLAFVVATGGDWMEAGRFLVPFLSLAAILAAAGLARTRLGRVLTVALAGLQIVGVLDVARHNSTGRPIWASFNHDLLAGAHHPSWYESHNRVHIRDADFLPRLEAVVDLVHQSLNRPVLVASGQAGMVMFYLHTERPGKVTFIDRFSLTGSAFDHCSQGMRPSSLGSEMSYTYWFSHLEECGVPLPDVVFEVGTFEKSGLGPDYVLVEDQPRVKLAASGWLAGKPTSSGQFVAVRANLAGAVG